MTTGTGDDSRAAKSELAACLARGANAFRAGDFAIAADFYRRAAEIEPGNRIAVANWAHALFQMQRFREVCAILGTSEAWRDNIAIQHLLVRALIESGALVQAEAEIARQQVSYPEDPDTAASVGFLRSRQDRKQDSYEAFRRAADLSKDHPIALTALL